MKITLIKRILHLFIIQMQILYIFIYFYKQEININDVTDIYKLILKKESNSNNLLFLCKDNDKIEIFIFILFAKEKKYHVILKK